jgi:thiol-disulfide isomerase/thioredoxin
MNKIFIPALLFLCLGSFTLPHAEEVVPILKEGTLAPTLLLPGLDGGMVALRDFCGPTLRNPWKNKTKSTVILSFFATYCVPCKKEIPQLQKFIQEHKDVVALLISIDKEGKDVLDPYQQNMKLELPILIDKYQKTAENFGVKKLPSMFIIDKKGILRFQSLNGFPEDANLEKILTEKLKMVDQQEKADAAAPAADAAPAAPLKNLTADQKLEIFRLVMKGEQIPEVAQKFQVEPQTVAEILKQSRDALSDYWKNH